MPRSLRLVFMAFSLVVSGSVLGQFFDDTR